MCLGGWKGTSRDLNFMRGPFEKGLRRRPGAAHTVRLDWADPSRSIPAARDRIRRPTSEGRQVIAKPLRPAGGPRLLAQIVPALAFRRSGVPLPPTGSKRVGG